MNTTVTVNLSWHLKEKQVKIPDEIKIAGITFAIVIIIMGIFGNLLIILSVILSKPLYKLSNIFVVSLACWDIFQTCCIRPLYVHTYIVGEWIFGPNVCLYALFANNLGILESILHVSAIAFLRYINIVHPQRAPMFQRLWPVLAILVAIYVLPLLIVMLPSIHRLQGPHEMNVNVLFNTRIMFCSFVRHTEFRPASILKKAIFLMCAAAFLLYCYIRIYRVVQASGKQINCRGHTNSVRLKREMTVLKTVIVIFLTFLFCYMPLTIIYGIDTKRTFNYSIYLVGVVLLWLSSSTNWMIYGLMNKQYLQAYRYILCGTHVKPNTAATDSMVSNGSKLSYKASLKSLAGSRRSRKSIIKIADNNGIIQSLV